MQAFPLCTCAESRCIAALAILHNWHCCFKCRQCASYAQQEKILLDYEESLGTRVLENITYVSHRAIHSSTSFVRSSHLFTSAVQMTTFAFSCSLHQPSG